MNNDVQQSISILKSLTPKLNTLTDEATDLGRQVEKFLTENGIGLGASIEIWIDHDELGAERRRSLDYENYGGKFQIVIRDSSRNSLITTRWEEVRSYAWSSAPRELRLEAFPKLPDLLKAITERVSQTVAHTTETAAVVKNLLGSLIHR